MTPMSRSDGAGRAAMSGADAFSAILNATSVAVIGASPRLDTIRGRTLAWPRRHGFGGEGELWAVNPHYDEVQGVPCVASARDLPAPADVALVAVPAEAVPSAVDDCGAAGIPTAIILSSGFAEVGSGGRKFQEDMCRAGQAGGVRLLGPNCIGVVNLLDDRALSFASGLGEWEGALSGGPVALITQSGAFGNLMMSVGRRRGIGFGHVITTGNEADLSWSDAAEYLSTDDRITTVVGYIEAVKNGPRFMEALELLRASGKRVAILKVGRSDRAARATAAHTGTLAGDDRVFDAVCARYGVIRVDDMRGLLTAATMPSSRPSSGRRMGVVTGSGGIAAMVADLCEVRGLTVPELSEELQAKIRGVIPAFGSARNPVDVTGQVVDNPGLREQVMRLLAESGEVDVVGMFLGANAQQEQRAIAEIASLAEESPIPLLTSWVGGTGNFVPGMNARGVPAFEDPTEAVDAMRFLMLAGAAPDPVSADSRQQESTAGGTAMDFADPLSTLESCGLPVVRRRVYGRRELIERVRSWPGQFYVKSVELGLAHKTEAGAVVGPIGAEGLDQVRQLMDRRSQADLFEVQEAVTSSAELLIGCREDPVFGYVGVVAAGGILTEVLNESCVFVRRSAPAP